VDEGTQYYLRRSRWLQMLLCDGSIHATGRVIGALMGSQTSPQNTTVETGQNTLADWAGLTGKNRRHNAGLYVRQLIDAGYFVRLRRGGIDKATGNNWTGAYRINLEIADKFQLRAERPPGEGHVSPAGGTGTLERDTGAGARAAEAKRERILIG